MTRIYYAEILLKNWLCDANQILKNAGAEACIALLKKRLSDIEVMKDPKNTASQIRFERALKRKQQRPEEEDEEYFKRMMGKHYERVFKEDSEE